MSASTVPLPAAFFHAVLQELAKRPEGIRRRDLYELVADAMSLSPAQRAERLPSLTHLRYRHRIGWSLNLLKTAGLIESSAPGIWCITPDGKRLLAGKPDSFDDETTRTITRDARAAGLRGEDEQDTDANRDGQMLQQAPEERIDAALNEMRHAVATDLLELISQAPPAFFEVGGWGLGRPPVSVMSTGCSVRDGEHARRFTRLSCISL
jgi:restriction system protein